MLEADNITDIEKYMIKKGLDKDHDIDYNESIMMIILYALLGILACLAPAIALFLYWNNETIDKDF